MKNPVTIPIYFKGESFREYETLKEDLGVETERPDITESELRDITFYVINGVHVYNEDDKEYGCVMSNGDEFISPLTAKTINKLIEENNN